MKSTLVVCICSLLLFGACRPRGGEQEGQAGGTPVLLRHAKGFRLVEADGYTMLTVLNPWKEGEVYARYYLVEDETKEVPSDGLKVKVPLQTLVANSATQLEFLQMLGVIDRVTGVCRVQYIYNPVVRQRVREGAVVDLGDAFNLDIERLLLLHPQAVMTTAYNVEDENAKRMRRTGLSLLYNIEWQERTLLGRAEWIKFVGAFFGKKAEADSLFRLVEQEYESCRRLAEDCEVRPSVMAGQDFRGTWYMPAGDSFNARLFGEAGADYLYAVDETSGSLSLTIEQALLQFRDADVWVGVQANTLEELGRADEKYKLFKAYREGRVYNYNRRTTPEGGNDYWESAVARPDRLLKDMIKVMHPELLPGYELFYMQRLP